jgi:hypothetical protein
MRHPLDHLSVPIPTPPPPQAPVGTVSMSDILEQMEHSVTSAASDVGSEEESDPQALQRILLPALNGGVGTRMGWACVSCVRPCRWCVCGREVGRKGGRRRRYNGS